MNAPATLSTPCRICRVLSLIGGRWKGSIIWHLMEEELRFAELKKRVHGISARVLTVQLRELEMDELVSREVVREKPLQVSYALTDLGRRLIPLLDQVQAWETANLSVQKPT